MSSFKTTAATAAVAAFAACGGTSSEYDDVATGRAALLADPAAGALGTFADLALVARGSAPSGLTTAGGTMEGLRSDLRVKYEVKCKDSSGGSTCDGSDTADVKVEWKGKVEGAQYKLEIEHKGDLQTKVIDSETSRVKGTLTLSYKSDFKDRAEDLRHKYDFDVTSRYDVVIRSSDGAIISGTLDEDMRAKEKEDDGTEKVKRELTLKIKVTFEAGETAEIDVDSKSKYKVHLRTGEID